MRATPLATDEKVTIPTRDVHIERLRTATEQSISRTMESLTTPVRKSA